MTAADHLAIHESPDGAWLRLRVTGELDLASVPALKQRLQQLHAEKTPVRLDLSRLEFIDSSGIRLLVTAANDARQDGWGFTLDPALSPQVDRVLRLMKLERIIGGPDPNGD